MRNKPIEVFTDASHMAKGSVLKQENKIIGFYSRKLNDVENKYSVSENEMFAIIKTMMFFRK